MTDRLPWLEVQDNYLSTIRTRQRSYAINLNAAKKEAKTFIKVTGSTVHRDPVSIHAKVNLVYTGGGWNLCLRPSGHLDIYPITAEEK